MTTSIGTYGTAAARSVTVTDDNLIVRLQDGRVVSVPIDWYPRLAEGSAAERRRWELIGPGVGIHWPSLDEDISVDGLLRGHRSGESASSLNRWRASRRRSAKRSRQSSRLATRAKGHGSRRVRG